jgi:hypothetical protein
MYVVITFLIDAGVIWAGSKAIGARINYLPALGLSVSLAAIRFGVKTLAEDDPLV